MLKMKKFRYGLVWLALIGSGCNPSTVLENSADDEMEEAAKHYMDLLLDGNYEAIISDLDPKIRKGNEKELFSRMGQFFPEQEPITIKLVGYTSMKFLRQHARYFFTYEYEYDQQWILVYVGFRNLSPKRKEIIQFNVTPIDRSLEETHRFSLKGKGDTHYGFLLICAVCPLFILYTVIACIRTKLKKRKWLWIIFILVGMFKFSLNWTTGQVWINLLSFQILGAGFVRASVYAPWIFMFSIPVGAILFWIKKGKGIRGVPNPFGDA